MNISVVLELYALKYALFNGHLTSIIDMGDTADTSEDAAQLQLADFVVDEQPSSFLKLTMSRRIKDKAIAEPKLIPFLLQLLETDSPSSASDDTSIVERVLYGTGSRRVVLLELSVSMQLRSCASCCTRSPASCWDVGPCTRNSPCPGRSRRRATAC